MLIWCLLFCCCWILSRSCHCPFRHLVEQDPWQLSAAQCLALHFLQASLGLAASSCGNWKMARAILIEVRQARRAIPWLRHRLIAVSEVCETTSRRWWLAVAG